MAVIFEATNRKKAVREAAERMMTAARTAPKGRGADNLAIALVEGEDIKMLSDKMREIAARGIPGPFERDSGNILQSEAIVLIGTKIKPMGLSYCGLCGFQSCAEKNTHPDAPCAFNTGDLGIAVGSAVSAAMDDRVDNRIMYSVGMAAKEMGLLGEDVKIIYGIPLSCTGKNPFFDRG